LKIKTSLTLRNEGTQEVFKKRVLWRIFVCKREEVTEGWRKLHNEELNDMIFSPDVGLIKRNCDVVSACGIRGGRIEMPVGLWLENLKENVGMNHVTI
jgi:hypothetical protein